VYVDELDAPWPALYAALRWLAERKAKRAFRAALADKGKTTGGDAESGSLASRARELTLALPGRFDSSSAPGFEGCFGLKFTDEKDHYSQEAQVRFAPGLMDLLGYDRAVLVGNSAGGTMALNIALEYPERVAGLVLVSPAVYGSGGAPGWIRPLFLLPGVNNIGPLLARRLSVDGDDFLCTTWYDESRINPAVISAYRRAATLATRRLLWHSWRHSADSGERIWRIGRGVKEGS